jgi:hypothetical protein
MTSRALEQAAEAQRLLASFDRPFAPGALVAGLRKIDPSFAKAVEAVCRLYCVPVTDETGRSDLVVYVPRD